MFTKPVGVLVAVVIKVLFMQFCFLEWTTIEQQEIGRTIHKQFMRGYVGPEVRGTKR